jgi:hypothetical protein
LIIPRAEPGGSFAGAIMTVFGRTKDRRRLESRLVRKSASASFEAGDIRKSD